MPLAVTDHRARGQSGTSGSAAGPSVCRSSGDHGATFSRSLNWPTLSGIHRAHEPLDGSQEFWRATELLFTTSNAIENAVRAHVSRILSFRALLYWSFNNEVKTTHARTHTAQLIWSYWSSFKCSSMGSTLVLKSNGNWVAWKWEHHHSAGRLKVSAGTI